MNDTSPWHDVAPKQLQRLDQICDRFEDAWRAGSSPRIEDYLSQVAEVDRAALFRELLPLDVHYRSVAGEHPTPEEYRQRFPAFGDMIGAVCEPQSSGVVNIGPPSAGSASSPTPRPLPEVPGYEILSILGRGGMGIVYKARHLKLNRLVALKTILGGYISAEQLGRFVNEGQATAKLQHPHIVQIHEIGEAETPYLALEFVSGGSLQKKLNGSPLPPREVAERLRVISGAVGHAHKEGIVHRDLKPANILLTADGQPKIADFGLAKMADAAGKLTVSGAILGTPAYMAPEQARGDSDRVGAAADIYALGVILFELLTGRLPFVSDSQAALLRKVEHDDPPSPRSLCATVPRDLEAICLMCLEKEPDDRYASTDHLAEDLSCYLAERPLKHARHTRPLGRLWRRCRRNPLTAALSATVVILASVVAGVLWSAATPPKPEGDISLVRVQRSGKFVVGVDPIGAPYSLIDKDNKLAGIDIEVAREIATRLGVTVDLVRVHFEWPSLVGQLDERKIDALISCVSITEDRKKQVAFVEYTLDPFVFVAHQGTTIRTRTDLDGKTLVVQHGTAAYGFAEQLQRTGVQLKILAEPMVPETFTAVRKSNDRVLLEHERIVRHALRGIEPKLRVFPSAAIHAHLADQRLGITLRSDAVALQAAVAQAIEEMKQDGSLQRIFDKWDCPQP